MWYDDGMDLQAAQQLANRMMVHYGLTQKGWIFAYDRAKSRLGLTDFRKKRISVSKYMTEAGTKEDFTQTMLHEIAHALLHPSAKHGKHWKDLAAKIGYTGGRTSSNPYRPEVAARNEMILAMKTVTAANSGVKVGDKLLLPTGEQAVVFKAARTRFHAHDPKTGKRWSILFGAAAQYKIS